MMTSDDPTSNPVAYPPAFRSISRSPASCCAGGAGCCGLALLALDAEDAAAPSFFAASSDDEEDATGSLVGWPRPALLEAGLAAVEVLRRRPMSWLAERYSSMVSACEVWGFVG